MNLETISADSGWVLLYFKFSRANSNSELRQNKRKLLSCLLVRNRFWKILWVSSWIPRPFQWIVQKKSDLGSQKASNVWICWQVSQFVVNYAAELIARSRTSLVKRSFSCQITKTTKQTQKWSNFRVDKFKFCPMEQLRRRAGRISE